MSYASLHAGLVRKGEAAPSLVLPPAPVPLATPAAIEGEASRWLVRRPPPPSPVAKVQERLGRGLIDFALSPAGRPRRPEPPAPRVVAPAEPPPAAATPPRPRRGSAARVVLTLKQEQARRLALAAARLGRPRARLLSEALDALLDGLAERELKSCGCYRDPDRNGACRARSSSAEEEERLQG